MIVHEIKHNETLPLSAIVLVEHGFNPDTYIIRLNVGDGLFLDTIAYSAERALQLYKRVIDALRWDDKC